MKALLCESFVHSAWHGIDTEGTWASDRQQASLWTGTTIGALSLLFCDHCTPRGRSLLSGIHPSLLLLSSHCLHLQRRHNHQEPVVGRGKQLWFFLPVQSSSGLSISSMLLFFPLSTRSRPTGNFIGFFLKISFVHLTSKVFIDSTEAYICNLVSYYYPLGV